MIKSAHFPFSSEPCVFDLPREWAAFKVAAAKDSVKLILWLTQARCMTQGILRQWALGLKSEPRATITPWSIMALTGGLGRRRM